MSRSLKEIVILLLIKVCYISRNYSKYIFGRSSQRVALRDAVFYTVCSVVLRILVVVVGHLGIS